MSDETVRRTELRERLKQLRRNAASEQLEIKELRQKLKHAKDELRETRVETHAVEAELAELNKATGSAS